MFNVKRKEQDGTEVIKEIPSDVEKLLQSEFGENYISHIKISGKNKSLYSDELKVVLTFDEEDYKAMCGDIAEHIGKEMLSDNNDSYVDKEMQTIDDIDDKVIGCLKGLKLSEYQIRTLQYKVSPKDYLDINDVRAFNAGNFRYQNDRSDYIEKMKFESSKHDSTISSIVQSMMGYDDSEDRFEPTGTIMRRGIDLISSDMQVILIDNEGALEELSELDKRPAAKNHVIGIQGTVSFEPDGVVGYSDTLSNSPIIYSSSKENVDATKLSLDNVKDNIDRIDTMIFGDGANSVNNPFSFNQQAIWNNDIVPNLGAAESILSSLASSYKNKETGKEAKILVVTDKALSKMGVERSKGSAFVSDYYGNVIEITKGMCVKLNLDHENQLCVNLSDYEKIQDTEFKKLRERSIDDLAF